MLSGFWFQREPLVAILTRFLEKDRKLWFKVLAYLLNLMETLSVISTHKKNV